MANWGLILFSSFVIITQVNSQQTTCSTQKFKNNNLYSECIDLPVLSSFLHYTYNSSNSSLSIAFLATPPNSNGWVSWAINPTSTGMVGSQALVAYVSNGVPNVKTYSVNSYSEIVESKLSFEVWDSSAEFVNGVMRIFAKVKVPEKVTTVNQVWQVGPGVSGNGRLAVHGFQPPNLQSKAILNFNGGGGGLVNTNNADVDSRILRRNIHGVLNVVSWGLLFPIGIIIARYLRTFPSADPAWFYLHVSCQISAYAIGVAGWGTGMKLGSESKGYQLSGHRNIGIALFSMATLQMFALFLRPKKDHKLRVYWNIYHHSVGYSIVILGIVNVFKGFNILSPEKKWITAYITVIAILGVIALFLEAITWSVVLRRKSNNSNKPFDSYNNGQSRQNPLAV